MKIKKLLNLALVSIPLLMAKPVLAKSDGYSKIEASFIKDCMTQPFPSQLPNVSASIRARYCGCYFDFVKKNFTYEEYLRIDKIIRENPQNLKNLPPKTLELFQQGFQECWAYARGQVNIKQEQELANLKQLEQQLIQLRNQGKLQDATLVAEEIVQKKSVYEEISILV